MYSAFVKEVCTCIGYVGVSWFKQPVELYFLYDCLLHNALISRVTSADTTDNLSNGYFKFSDIHMVLDTDFSNSVQESSFFIGYDGNDESYFSVLKLKLGEMNFTEVDSSHCTISSFMKLPDGTQWSGSCLGNKPYGYGKLYDKNDHLIYKGFMYNNIRVCFGSEYDPISSKLIYKGGFVNNIRYGFGESFDCQGNTVHSGKWIDGRFVS